MRGGLVALIMLLFSLPMLAGTITLNFGTPIIITTTATQDAAIVRLLAIENANRAEQIPPLPAWTAEQWLRSVLVGALQSHVERASAYEATEACAAYRKLGAGAQTTIRTSLGGSPCP